MTVSLAKSATARVSLVKVTDALDAPVNVLSGLLSNDLDALSTMFAIIDVRRVLELEEDLLRLDQWSPVDAFGVNGSPIYLERAIDAQLDALTAGKYRSTAR